MTTNVGFLLAKASRHFNEMLLERFAERGFPDVRASYGSVLVPLFERDGLRLGELAALSRLSKQAMTGLVKLCEQDGLVTRERDVNDGRAFRVFLSARAVASTRWPTNCCWSSMRDWCGRSVHANTMRL